jgi:Family of unknown function (DUF6600)
MELSSTGLPIFGFGGRELTMKRTRTNRIQQLLLQLVTLFLAAVPAQMFADAGDPPGRAARLSYTEGSVSLQPSGESQWSQAELNYTLTTGDRLYADQNSRAELEVGPFAVRISQDTDLTLANLNDQIMQLGLGQGSIRVSVYELPSGNTVEIDTPNGALTALGPGSYRVDVDPNNGTRVSVNRGSLQISGGGADQTVQAGQAAQLTGTGPIEISSIPLPGPDDFDDWSASRDQRVEAFRSRQYVSPYIPGAEDLDAYGRWDTVPEYGPVWYPSGVAAGWVPYRFGRWAWVDPWGWTWVENEPWGFCPFHYGRWAFIGSAWGWVPGPVVVAPVYAPALVAFVGGGGFSFGFSIGGVSAAAWFPLGPREPFFPWYHHGGNYLRQVNVTNIRNVTNITNITNITNVRNIHYVNERVATTAVPTQVFRSGQPVAQRVVHVAPQQLAKAQVIPHPSVMPTPTAVFAGRTPVKAPPVRVARVTGPPAGARTSLPVRGAAPPTPSGGRTSAPPVTGRTAPPVTREQPPTVGGRPSTPPPITRSAPPVAGKAPAERPETVQPRPAPPAANRNQPGQWHTFSGPPPATPPRVITRSAPPPRNIPFTAREPAMSQHPGRPLEPQQEQNIRQGRPAGPMRDTEVPPHPQLGPRTTAPARTQSPSQGRPSAQSKSESKAGNRPGRKQQ